MNWPALTCITEQVSWNLCCTLWHPGLVPRGAHAHWGNSEFSSCLLARRRNKSWPLSQEGIIHFPLSLLLSPGTAPPCPGVWAQEHGAFHKESVWNLLWKTKLIQLNVGGEMWCWPSQEIRIPLLSPPHSGLPSGPSCRSQEDACFDFSWKGLVDIDGKSDLWFRCYFHTDNLSILLSTWRGWKTNSCIFWQCLLSAKFVILKSFYSLSVPDGAAEPAKQLQVKGASTYAHFVIWFCGE